MPFPNVGSGVVKIHHWQIMSDITLGHRLARELRRRVGIIRTLRPWVSGHTDFLLSQFSHSERNIDRDYTDDDHLLAAVRWLETAQDVTPDDGVVGRYSLEVGWTSSYPETTGYIVPTFVKLAEHLGEPQMMERAKKAIDFLIGLQLDSGAFPGGEVHQNTDNPSPFNSAQIIHGLTEWHQATGCQHALASAHRAAEWLLTVQDEDGGFRKHFYLNTPATYSAHLSCWLAQLGQHTNNSKYLYAVDKHMDWVMIQYDSSTGWFDLCGFDDVQHRDRTAFTHTIAYTIWGVLYCGEILGRDDLIQAATNAARGIARRVELSRCLPGILDSNWCGSKDFVCLTGNAQMALIWMRLYELTQDPWWLNPAFKAIDGVKQAQFLEGSNVGIKGGIPGSYPIWGDYIFAGIPNWAAKYFIDALLAKKRILSTLAGREKSAERSISELPRTLPAISDSNPSKEPSIVVLTRANSIQLQHFANEWEKRGVRPSAVVFEETPSEPKLKGIQRIIRERGFKGLLRRLMSVRKTVEDPAPSQPNSGTQTAIEYCKQHGIATLRVGPLVTEDAQTKIRKLNPDVLVQAGVGILRKGLLDIPSIGTLNVHMSILPLYRGMNVGEWAAFNGHRNGCTVHLIDEGIDTGDVLLVREVSRESCNSIQALRRDIDTAQRELLAEVLEYIAKTGSPPPSYRQESESGTQYFAMHPDLQRILTDELAG